jgi:hypothetical protein
MAGQGDSPRAAHKPAILAPIVGARPAARLIPTRGTRLRPSRYHLRPAVSHRVEQSVPRRQIWQPNSRPMSMDPLEHRALIRASRDHPLCLHIGQVSTIARGRKDKSLDPAAEDAADSIC